MSDMPFPATPRVDALDKVRGKPLFGSDDARPGLLHAAFAVATIGKGQITGLDIKAAGAVPGVRLVLTHETIGAVKSAGFLLGGGYGFQSLQPLLSPAIAYRGQPIALVAADTLEAAIEAAQLVKASYAAETHSVTLDASGTQTVNQADTPLNDFFPEIKAGDADKAYAEAPVKIEAVFTCPQQHQNPIELIATVAEWRGDKLIIHEGTQSAEAVRHGLVMALGLKPEQVEVISPSAVITSGWGPTRPARWLPQSTRWTRRLPGTICFQANTPRPARACTVFRISAARNGWCGRTCRHRAICARRSSIRRPLS